MNAAHWDELEALFGKALALSPDERSAFLDGACGDDATLRAELDSLLAHYKKAPEYFDNLADAVPVPAVSGTPPPAAVDALLGASFSHYLILERLGQGGMGVVYKARDTDLDRIAALKFLPPHLSTDPKTQQRFIAEAKAASALDHPNICTIYEIGDSREPIGEAEARRLFIAMAYYEGETLKRKIERGPLPVDEALHLATQLARGLARAHAKDIIHRDIKPANLLINAPETTEAGYGTLKILDFGLAKMADVQLTQTGATMGTVAYMSPEQTRGEAVDHRSDLWSVGVVLYEMLTGQRPFQGDYRQAVIYAVLNEDPPPITALNPALPEALEHVVAMCLEKDKASRYLNMTDLLADLEVLVQGTAPDPTSDTSALLHALPRRSRHRPRRALGVGAVLLVLVAIGAALFYFAFPPAARRAAVMPAQMHLAVLPFENVGGDPANQAFVDGLVYTVTTKLAGMEQFQNALSVVPARDVMTASITTSAQAARTLQVNLVITGEVQRLGDMVRLTLNLVDPLSERVLRPLTLDERPTDLLALQDSVVLRLAAQLDLELNPQARELLTAGGTTVPKAFDYYAQGLGYLQRYEEEANIDAAIGLFKLAVEEDATYALAYAALGEAYWRKYETSDDPRWVEAAIKNGNEAVKRDSDSAPVRITMGMIYKGTGRHEDAETAFLHALRLEPRAAAAHHELGDLYHQQNKLPKAEDSYEQAIDLKPAYWLYHNSLGQYYHRLGLHNEAIPYFQKVIALRPENPWGYNNLAAQYHRLGNLDEAIPYYLEATRVNVDAARATARAYSNLAGIYYTQNDFAQAAQMYRKAVALQATSYWDWESLGDSYHWLGDDAQAREAWHRAVELAHDQLDVNPLDAEALGYLAEDYARLGETQNAQTMIDRLLALERQDAEILIKIGRAYEMLGDRRLALRYMEAALANGYTLPSLDASAWLDDLRNDTRYQQIIQPYLSPNTSPP